MLKVESELHSCFVLYVLCCMFCVLCFMFCVLCFVFYVLCFMFYVKQFPLLTHYRLRDFQVVGSGDFDILIAALNHFNFLLSKKFYYAGVIRNGNALLF